MVFGGTKGAILKPFVPTQRMVTIKADAFSKDAQIHSETGMQKKDKFDFMKEDIDLNEAQKEELKLREKHLDQAWYGDDDFEGGVGPQNNDLFDSYAD